MTRHDPYAVHPPRESFDYIVDGDAICRMPPGSPRLLEAAHSAVRLAPDSEYRAWRNEYVLVREEIAVFPGCTPIPVLHVRGSVYLRERGLGVDILDFEAVVIDPAGEALVSVAATGDERNAIERKAQRAIDWYKAELKLRDTGEKPLLTARQLWLGEDWARRPS